MLKAGDKVRDISGHFIKVYGLDKSPIGMLAGKEDGDWVIDWDGYSYDRVNWHDEQIELVEPAEIVEREACCSVLARMRKDRQMLKLHLGEMTAQEMRTLIAGLHLAELMVRNRT